MSHASLKKIKAFTLVELLVVITIIGVLVAMLLPSLSKAREAAKRVTCLTRERGIGTAMLTWETDRRALPNVKLSQWTYETTEGMPYADSDCTSAGGVNQDYQGNDHLAKLLVDYVGAPLKRFPGYYAGTGNMAWASSNVLRCPSAMDNAPAFNYPTDGSYGAWYVWGGLRMSYFAVGVNQCAWEGNNPGPLTKRRSDKISNPTRVLMVTEPCMNGNSAYMTNNHQLGGLNAVRFDGSGKWHDYANETVVVHAHNTVGGSGRFGDVAVDITTNFRMAKDYWYIAYASGYRYFNPETNVWTYPWQQPQYHGYLGY